MEPFYESIISRIYHHNYCLVGVTNSGRVLRLDPAHQNTELYVLGRILEFHPNGDPSGPCRVTIYDKGGVTKVGDDYLFL